MKISNKFFPKGITVNGKDMIVVSDVTGNTDVSVIVFRGTGGFPFSGIGEANFGGEGIKIGNEYAVVSYPGPLTSEEAVVQKTRFLNDSGSVYGNTLGLDWSSLIKFNPFPVLTTGGSSGSPIIEKGKIKAILLSKHEELIGFLPIDILMKTKINSLLETAMKSFANKK